jgi:hypothetical protein
MIARILAWLLLLGAAAAAGRDGLALLETGPYRPIALGEIWQAANPSSLQWIERILPSFLWANVLAPPLRWPAWAVLAGLAVILLLLAGRGRRRKWRSGSLG